MKVILWIVGLFVAVRLLVWAWPFIVAVTLGGAAGLLGGLEVLFVAFVAWCLLAQMFDKTKWGDVDSSTHEHWGTFYLVAGFVGGVVSYIRANGNFFTWYVPWMAVGAVVLGALPAWLARPEKRKVRPRSPRTADVTPDGRIIQRTATNMADLDVDLDISAPIRNRG